jgi:hypothetical protein
MQVLDPDQEQKHDGAPTRALSLQHHQKLDGLSNLRLIEHPPKFSLIIETLSNVGEYFP